MRPVLLVARNFLRENRWPVLILMVWGVASGAAAARSVRTSQDDALFFLKQQAIYSVFFTVFLAASAIYNQRKTRRILAVLAKGIDRRQYLAGLLFGYSGVALLYAIALGATGALTFARAGYDASAAVPLILMLLVASVLTGTVALFFSTFMNPLFALVCTSLVLGASAFVTEVLGSHANAFLPSYLLLQRVIDFSFHSRLNVPWRAMIWAMVESVALWVLASAIFDRRDIAVPIE